nr:hypothetical protein [Xenorhabdus sp. Flor]
MPVHSHRFSATTSNFDYGSKSATTSSSGEHSHGLWSDRTWEEAGSPVGLGRSNPYLGVAGATHGSAWPGYLSTTGNGTQLIANNGRHTHTISVPIGSHNYTVSGSTDNSGSGSAIIVTNAFIKLMGWYRIS